jgi:ABC-type lipoprotein export system ATPase subunit
VSKHYPADGHPGSSANVAVLKGVDLEVRAGESLAVTGPSGCGKSTLLSLIGTLDRPSHGSLELEGRDLAALDDTELAAIRARKLGFVFQLHHLLPQCTVWENVLVPTLALADCALAETAPQRARRLLDRVGLTPRLGHRPAELSGGERQRVALVRALINQPRLLLADEPTGALDRTSAEQLVTLLDALNREEGLTMIVVTHAREVAARMQREMELRDGVVRALRPA